MGDFFKNAGTAVIIAAAAILFVLIISGCTGSVSYYDENGKLIRMEQSSNIFSDLAEKVFAGGMAK